MKNLKIDTDTVQEAVGELIKEIFNHGISMQDIIDLFNTDRSKNLFISKANMPACRGFMINKETTKTSGVYIVFLSDASVRFFGCTVGVYDIYPIQNTDMGRYINISEYYIINGNFEDNILHIKIEDMPRNYGNIFYHELKELPYGFERCIKNNKDEIELFTHKLRLMLKDIQFTKDDITEEIIEEKGQGRFI
jgi:hypothetical protein